MTQKLALFLVLCMSLRFAAHEAKETNLTLYMQDFANPPNNTFIAVAGIAGKLWTFTQFGTVYATDDALTEGPNVTSPSVGRAQGMYVVSSLNGQNLLLVLSLVFTNKAYNGSTIELQGTSRQFEATRELAVVSGTGKFRFASGYATFENYFFNIPSGYTIIKFKVTVRH